MDTSHRADLQAKPGGGLLIILPRIGRETKRGPQRFKQFGAAIGGLFLAGQLQGELQHRKCLKRFRIGSTIGPLDKAPSGGLKRTWSGLRMHSRR